jgi:hypothetical protein
MQGEGFPERGLHRKPALCVGASILKFISSAVAFTRSNGAAPGDIPPCSKAANRPPVWSMTGHEYLWQPCGGWLGSSVLRVAFRAEGRPHAAVEYKSTFFGRWRFCKLINQFDCLVSSQFRTTLDSRLTMSASQAQSQSPENQADQAAAQAQNTDASSNGTEGDSTSASSLRCEPW